MNAKKGRSVAVALALALSLAGAGSAADHVPSDAGDALVGPPARDVWQGADRILEGTIVGEHPGLMIGEVGELLEVSVDRTIKGDPLDRILLFYPFLKMMVGRAAVCRQDPTFGPAPRSGDRVVFFQLGNPSNERGNLFKPERTEMIFAEAEGGLRSPAEDLLPRGMKTFDELDVAVRVLVDGR